MYIFIFILFPSAIMPDIHLEKNYKLVFIYRLTVAKIVEVIIKYDYLLH